MRKQKDNYLTHWKELTKKQSKLECYWALNREYTVAEYLTTVTDPNLRNALTMYILSEHSLAFEKGRCRQTWLSREDKLCAHCPQNEVETELHFLTSCPMYDHVKTHISLRLNRLTNTIVNTTYIYVDLFSLFYLKYWHIITTLYIDIITFEMSLLFWNFCERNVYCAFCVVNFTFVYYLFHLLWQYKYMFPMPIHLLNWIELRKRERERQREREREESI